MASAIRKALGPIVKRLSDAHTEVKRLLDLPPDQQTANIQLLRVIKEKLLKYSDTYQRKYSEWLSLADEVAGEMAKIDEDLPHHSNLTVNTDDAVALLNSTIAEIERQQESVRAQAELNRRDQLWAQAAPVPLARPAVTVKLPKLELEKFDGEIINWPSFWDRFQISVHQNTSISDVDKFNYLKAHLTGRAHRAIAGLAVTAANYPGAIDILKKRFGAKNAVVNAHYTALANLAPATGSMNEDEYKRFLQNSVRGGKSNKIILSYLQKDYGIKIRLRTLKSHLLKFGIKRKDTTISPAEIDNAIAEESRGAGQNFGIRMMHQALRRRHGLLVTRQQVAVAMARNGQLHRFAVARTFPWNRCMRYCPGPNFRWSEDGHDKLGKYDIFIHGCLDEYSRKIMWMRAFVTNRQADLVCSYYLDAVRRFGVVPNCVISDFGWESTLIAQCQAMFYAHDTNPAAHHRWTFSVQNVTVESWWRRLRQLCTMYWQSEFQTLEMEGLWSGDVLDRWALLAVYLPLINEDLARTVIDHNTHTIRSQRGRLRPGGQPDDLYSLPEQFGGRQCGLHVHGQEVNGIENALNIPMIDTTCALPGPVEEMVNDFFIRNGIHVQRENAKQLYMQVRAMFQSVCD